MTSSQRPPVTEGWIDDIVERLRDHSLFNKAERCAMFDEAADEIAGLREANHHYRDCAARDEKSIAALKARVDELTAALQECVDVFGLAEQPAFVDPDYGDEVAALGNRIGYGALMSSASASWRERLKEEDCPTGGEFVAGPCFATVARTLKIARDALTPGARP